MFRLHVIWRNNFVTMNELFLSDIFLGVIDYTVSVNLMVIVILISRKFLIAIGNVQIQLNEDPDRILKVQAGDKLLQTLANEEMFLSSACGGKGTCAQCKCAVSYTHLTLPTNREV